MPAIARGPAVNPNLAKLQPYPFEKLRQLFAGVTPPSDLKPIKLSIGEPQHATPEFIKEALAAGLARAGELSHDRRHATTCAAPSPTGSDARYDLPAPDAGQAGAAGQWLARGPVRLRPVRHRCAARPDPLVLCPNPFYQIYEGAAYLAGADAALSQSAAGRTVSPSDFAAVPEDDWRARATDLRLLAGQPDRQGA